MSQPYYYACSYPLVPGSVVEKGNWGRICRVESLSANLPRLLKEMIFENVRLKEFPHRPSRFDCNFICPNLLSLRRFREHTSKNRPFDLFYEVEPTDMNARRLETDWSLVDQAGALMSQASTNVAAVEKIARRYWNPEGIAEDLKEVLFESDIKIIRRIVLG